VVDLVVGKERKFSQGGSAEEGESDFKQGKEDD
jgi:hypothetical protein